MPASPCTPWHLARRAKRLEPSVIREILKITEKPGIISLAGGLPAAVATTAVAPQGRQGIERANVPVWPRPGRPGSFPV